MDNLGMQAAASFHSWHHSSVVFPKIAFTIWKQKMLSMPIIAGTIRTAISYSGVTKIKIPCTRFGFTSAKTLWIAHSVTILLSSISAWIVCDAIKVCTAKIVKMFGIVGTDMTSRDVHAVLLASAYDRRIYMHSTNL